MVLGSLCVASCCPKWRSLGALFIKRRVEGGNWMMDWCAIDSDADFVLLCCGEEKTECESEALNFVICFSLSTHSFFFFLKTKWNDGYWYTSPAPFVIISCLLLAVCCICQNAFSYPEMSCLPRAIVTATHTLLIQQDRQYCSCICVCVCEREGKKLCEESSVCCKVFMFLSGQSQTSVRSLIFSFVPALDCACVCVEGCLCFYCSI